MLHRVVSLTKFTAPQGEMMPKSSSWQPRRLMVLLAIMISIALVASGCGDDDDGEDAAEEPAAQAPSEPDDSSERSDGPNTPVPDPLPTRAKIRVTIPALIENFAPVHLARFFGEFEKENLDVSIEVVDTSSAVALVAQGQADVQMGSLSAAYFNAVDSGVTLKWVAPGPSPSPSSREGLWVRNELVGNDGKIEPEEMAGKSIVPGGAGAGAPVALPIAKWLEEGGLTLNDVEIQQLRGGDILIALENGGIDSGWLLNPYWQEAERKGFATRVVGEWDKPLGGIFFGKTLLGDNNLAGEAFVRAVLRTVRTYLQGDYHADPEVVKALADELDQPAENFPAGSSLVFDPDLELDASAAEDMQETYMQIDGLLLYADPKPASALVDTRFLEELTTGTN